MKSGSDEGELEFVVHYHDRDQKVEVMVPPPRSARHRLKEAVKEVLFPDDPLREIRKQSSVSRKLLMGFQYLFPVLQWAPKYSFHLFKSDVISGITIASLAIPQGISYAKLAHLPPIIGLYSSFVPPIIYVILGSSKDLAVGTVAVVSLILASKIGSEVSPEGNPHLYMRLVFTATFFAGVFQASLGLLRLGFIIDFLSHATIVGFMAGAATIVCLQQLKVILGLRHFTSKTDVVSVMSSVSKQVDKWRWESIVMGICFLCFLLLSRYISKNRPKLMLIAAGAPLLSVALGSILVFCTRAENHGIQIVGHLKKGLNPLSLDMLVFETEYLMITLKAGVISGIISLTEGIAVGRTFSMFKNYHIDGNKEMMAIGMMNIVGSCTSCYITTGPFSRSAVNFNAGCKTAVSNLVMATSLMITLLFLTPLFHYTPMVVLASILVSAMLGIIDVKAAYHMWRVDKIDFVVCMAAFMGVVFGNFEIGLMIAVSISVARVMLHVIRPRIAVLENICGTSIYRNKEQYPHSARISGILILSLSSPIYFANCNYMRERVLRWIEEEEEYHLANCSPENLHYIVLDMSGVSSIDTGGISMLEELKMTLQNRELELAFANPGPELMEKLHKSKFKQLVDPKWMFLTVGEAVNVCSSLLRDRTFNLTTSKPGVDDLEIGCNRVPTHDNQTNIE